MLDRAIYPGSFDPPTIAHRDILLQACPIFDEITVVVANNTTKGRSLLPPELRVEAWRKMCVGVDVTLADADDPITHTAELLDARFIIRGLRGISDVEPEQAYREFVEHSGRGRIRTLYFMSPPALQHVSSTAVRAIVGLNGWRWDLKRYLTSEVIGLIPDQPKPQS